VRSSRSKKRNALTAASFICTHFALEHASGADCLIGVQPKRVQEGSRYACGSSALTTASNNLWVAFGPFLR
jgi:hypothetical protein